MGPRILNVFESLIFNGSVFSVDLVCKEELNLIEIERGQNIHCKGEWVKNIPFDKKCSQKERD